MKKKKEDRGEVPVGKRYRSEEDRRKKRYRGRKEQEAGRDDTHT